MRTQKLFSEETKNQIQLFTKIFYGDLEKSFFINISGRCLKKPEWFNWYF